MFRGTFLALALLTAAAPAADWPQFLGPARDGRSTEKVSTTFDGGEPPVMWRKAVGHGFAGPAVADGHVILFHRQGSEAVIEAFDVKTGNSMWKHTAPTSYRDDFGFDDGPRSTPTVAGGRVFAYGADGRLTAVDAATGRELWTKDLAADFHAPKGWFGRCCAPLVVDGRVLVNMGGTHEGKPAGVAAFDVQTGALAWTGSADEASYSSPVLAKFAAGPAVVFFTRKGVELLDPATGRTLAQDAFEPEIAASVSACTPVLLGGDSFFLSGCYGLGAKVWSVGAKFALSEKWASADALDCHYGTPVLHAGHLYGFHGRQEQGQELRCVSAVDGRVKWRQPMAAGTVLVAGGTLVVLTEKGELVLAPASAEAFAPTARGQVLGATSRAFPALADGRFFARDGKNLVCVRLGPQ